MPEVSQRALDLIFESDNAAAAIETLLDAKAFAEFKKTGKLPATLTKLVGQLLSGDQRAQLKTLTREEAVNLLQATNETRIEQKRVSGQETRATKVVEGQQRRATAAAKVPNQLDLLRGTKEIEREFALQDTPAQAQARLDADVVRGRIKKLGQGTNTPEVLIPRIDAIKTEIPLEAAALREELNAVSGVRKQQGYRLLEKRLGSAPSEVAKIPIDSFVNLTGKTFGTILGKDVIATKVNEIRLEQGVASAIGQASGQRAVVDASTGTVTLVSGKSPPAGVAEQVTQAFSLAKRGKTSQAAELSTTIGKALRGGLSKGKLIGGGILGALLLPMLLGGKKNEQQQLPPLLQIQLLQQLSELQNQNALTQSLVGSRGAQADKNTAQADLLRLQLLGGLTGQGRGII